MHHKCAPSAFLLAALVAACADDSSNPIQTANAPTPADEALLARGGVAPRNFTAVLNGDAEIPTNDSRGRGLAHLQLNPAGTELSFRLNAANIEDVTQAHIHCGSAAVNGPVVAFLYGLGPTVSPNGQLSDGTITAANVISRPDSEACPGGVADFDDLIAKMEAGEAYVNAHTVALPGGEIRGQINPAGSVKP